MLGTAAGGIDLDWRTGRRGRYNMASMSSPRPSTLRVAAVVLATAASACVQSSRNAEAAVLACRDLGGLLSAYQTVHYSVRRITPRLKERAVEQFVRALDPSRSLLLDAEVGSIREHLVETFDVLRRGNCEALDETFALVRGRAAEDTARARKVLAAEDFAIDRSIELMVDPEERGYPKSKAEREKLGLALLHFQMANYVKGGVEIEKAKEQLVHRYELTEKRLAERVEEERLPEMFAEAFARALDPHTAYLSHDQLMDFQINMRLSLEGIGAALRSEDGFTYIESLIPGGGAEKSGKLQPKDKIIAVEQEGPDAEPVSTIDMSIQDVVKLIRGPKGTKVTLTVLREGATTKTFDVTIVRDRIDVKQQAAKLDVQERTVGGKTTRIGVLELPSFYGSSDDEAGRSSYEDVKKLIGEAKEQGVEALVLDLHKNGGGYLEEAVRISGLFIREGAIVATKDTDDDHVILRDTDDDTEWAGPLVVLVSPMSASASEILAGSLHAYGRALVVGAGTTSFGKGSVQTLRPLPRNLGAMKVTTGMYFLPSGHSTQRVGVDIDIEVPSLFSTIDVGEKDLDYSLPPQRMKAFLSDGVNGRGVDRWKPVDQATVARLAQRSRARIERKPAFREVEEAIAEAKERKERLSIAELLADDEPAETEAEAKSGSAGEPGEPTARADGSAKAPASAEEDDEEPNEFERGEAALVAEAVDIAVDLARPDASNRSKKNLGARDALRD